MSAEIQSARIFIAYSSRDLEYQIELKNHLEPLVRNKRIVIMDNYAINPGDNWNEKIGQMLEISDIVLLLLSADSLASPHFFREAGIAIERRRQGRTEIIPVKLRPCDLDDEPLLQELNLLEVLPEKDVPVVKWQHRDEAYLSIVKGLKTVLRVREEAAVAREQHTQRQREYADLISQADALTKKKKWSEAKALLDKALKMWEEGFEPSRKLLEKLIGKCKEEIIAIEAGERKKQQAVAEAVDNAEWQIAEEADTEAAYRKYLSKNPEGLHDAAAKAKLDAFEKKRAAALVAEKEAERKAKEEAEKKKKEEAESKRRKAEEAEKKKNNPFADLMLHIKGGSFDMGDTFGDGYDSEKPVHRVAVKDFYLCKYPVTQAQWKAVMGDNPSYFKGDDLPVENVSWDDAQAFIKKLNEKTGKRYRLPSEAEWEYAARGGEKSKNFKYAGSDNLDEVAWHGGSSGSKTHPVGQKKPNELGLFDMSGNVWEWCEDWYDATFYKKCAAKATVENPKNDEKGSDRVLRGGSWFSVNPRICRVADRYDVYPGARYDDIGFRLAASPSSQ